MLRKLMKRMRQDERGFTLIELMIVILVILVLAAILIPQFGLARERARKASCVSNQRNLETAVAMWQTDNPSTNLQGGDLNASIPSATTLSGSPQYALAGMYVEPDDATVTTGADYYLSNGTAAGTQANAVPTNPSYAHVACQADKTADGWVAGYDGTSGAVNNINHTRGAQASP
ncbi:MAG TPA: type II secretion system protein [bacterium]|nr:type II secretion system protein [bacterium]